MSSRPLVSVVIVNWNKRDDLKECLESVRTQTYKNIEIIVVDNHSTDGSIERIREYFPEVKLIVMPDPSYGACETFNIGFANATGTYIVVMDNDATLEERWIETAITKFDMEDAKIALIAPKVIHRASGKLQWPSKRYKEFEHYVDSFLGCGVIVKKFVLAEVGGYPKRFFIYTNESDLAIKILNRGYKLLYFPQITTFHKGMQEEIYSMSPRQFYYSFSNELWVTWKYYPFKKLLFFTLFRLYLFTKLSVKKRYFVVFFKSIFRAILGIPYCIRERAPCYAEELNNWRRK